MSLARGKEQDSGPKVEINVVPLVDVSLVLLIIFMVTATFVKATGAHLDLPSSPTAQSISIPKRELVIGISRQGQFLFSGAPVTDTQLGQMLSDEAAKFGAKSQVTIQGDTHAEYGRVVNAMSIAQQAGFSNLVVAMRKDGQGKP